MSRYIDADKLRALFDNNSKVSGAFYCAEWEGIDKPSDFQDLIDTQPTADVRENVRGEWVRIKDTVQCSQCKAKWIDHTYLIETFRFCPNCGADMRPQDSLSTLNKQDKEE